MEIVLVVPHLIALGDSPAGNPNAPRLAALLAAAGVPRRNDDGLDAALASRYGVTRQTDWPLAPIRLAACGVDPGRAFWFCADPVTLVVGRDDVSLGGIVDDLDAAGAAALVETLNAHFAADGVTFVAPRPDAMFARIDPAPRLATRPLPAAIGRGIRPLQPTGSDAVRWNRWQSEIQMLLHEHPVNLAREALGRPPANSVWFSRGGTRPVPQSGAGAPRTFADGGIATALALHAGAPARPVPARLADALAVAGSAPRTLVALERDLTLATLERHWAEPAHEALVTAKLRSVTLVADDLGAAVEWEAQRPPLWERMTGRWHRSDLAALLDGGHRDP